MGAIVLKISKKFLVVGRISRGMLVGVNLYTFDIGEIQEGDFFIKLKLQNRQDGFQWPLVFVHGTTQQ